MKLKSNFMYIIAFIFSIYASYLISRLYTLGINGIMCISITNIFISIFLTYLWKKNIKFYKISKKNKIIIFFIITIISILVLLFNWKIFTYEFNKTVVNIYSENLDLNDIKIFNGFVANNISYVEKNNKVYDNLEWRENDGIKIQLVNANNLRIDFDKYIDIKIILNKQNDNIRIQDGEDFSTIKFIENTYTYNVISNSFKDNNFKIRMILSFLLIIYVVTLLVLSIVFISKEKRAVFITLTICAISGLLYSKLFITGVLYPDSGTMMIYNFHDIIAGRFNARVPVYPFILKVFSMIFGNQYIYFVCILQHILWFISIVFLYKLLQLLIKNKKIVILMTILYSLCPAIIDWANIILTESIALSGSIIFIYFIVKYIKQPKLLTGNIAVMIAFILTFHRPTSIIYVCFLELFWIARFILDRSNIKVDYKCFINSTFSIILIVIYAVIFEKTYGIYSISDAVPRQDLYVCMQEGYYKKSNDEQFVNRVEEALNSNPDSLWNAMVKVLNQYSLKDIKQLTNYCRLQSISEYIQYLIDLNKTCASEVFNHYSFKIVDSNLKWLQNVLVELFVFITFEHVYIVIGIEFALLVYNWVKTKKVPWTHLGLFAFPLVIIESSFIGTCSEFMRTAICALPFAYISIAIYFDMLTTNKVIKEEK